MDRVRLYFGRDCNEFRCYTQGSMSSSPSADFSSGRFALNASPRILIAGYGRMGAALGKRLASEGCLVWGLSRSLPAQFSLVRFIQADLLNVASLSSLPTPLDYVFYLASCDSSELTAYRRAYVDGLQNLLDALERVRANVIRLFFSSSTGVYGQKEGEWVDESSIAAPDYPEGEILLEGERLVITGPVSGTVVRFGGIYGPERNRLLEQVTAGEAVCSYEARYTNHIHVDDCAGILRHLMTMEDPEPVYLAVDREPVERCEFLRWVAQQMDAPDRK